MDLLIWIFIILLGLTSSMSAFILGFFIGGANMANEFKAKKAASCPSPLPGSKEDPYIYDKTGLAIGIKGQDGS